MKSLEEEPSFPALDTVKYLSVIKYGFKKSIPWLWVKNFLAATDPKGYSKDVGR